MKNTIKETLAFKELSDGEKKARGILGRLYGPCADFINPTRNGRNYSDELWEKVFNENELVKEAFANGGIPGELDHPADREEIDTSKVAIIMPEAPKKDDQGHLIAYFDILDTPNGRIAYTLAKYGYKFGISSRGTGEVIGDDVDPDTYDFKCFDLVLTPSVKDARLSMTESLDTSKLAMKKALAESLESANASDKKVMEETLNNLNIDLKEDKEEAEEEIKLDLEEPLEPVTADEVTFEKEEEVEKKPEELSFDEKIETLLALIYPADKAPTDKEKEAFIAAFKSLFPENECSSESCADKEETPEVEEPTEETVDDIEDDSLILQLQDALKVKADLDLQVKNLQEQLAVSDTKVNELNEDLTKYKSAAIRLSDIAHRVKPLKEELEKSANLLKEKDTQLQQLAENAAKSSEETSSLNESLKRRDSTLVALKESFNQKEKELNATIDSLKESLQNEKQSAEKNLRLKESYKKMANDVANHYIKLKANMIGVDADVIKSKLPSSYELKDVDAICESLQDYSLSMNNLPFDLRQDKIKKVQVTESKKDNLAIPSFYDDTVDDSLLTLAKIGK